MALSEQDRHDAFDALKSAFGDQTEAVIKMLRPDDDRLATKDDVALSAAGVRADFAQLRGEFGELRGEFGELRGEFGELRAEMAEMRVGLEVRITDAFQAQTRALVIGLVVAVFLIALSNTVTVLVA